METLLAIIFIVFGLLQIILFFKLWGMTNDIKYIKNDLNKNEYVVDAKTAYLNGQKQIAQEILDKALIIIEEEIKNNSYSNEPKIKKQQIIDMIKYLGLNLEEDKDNKYKIGDLVIWIAREQQMRIESITMDGKYRCTSDNGMRHVGDFLEEEIKLLEQ